jgi:integrase
MTNGCSGAHKETRKERLAKLPAEMQERLGEFELGLHGVRDNTKADYLGRMTSFGSFLMSKGKKSFDKAERKDIDLFLSNYSNPATKNVFIAVFRHFYILKPELVSHLKVYEIDLEEITPSEILTPAEVVALAVEAGKKREIYKYLILTLFESCARISELLNLKLGDVVFSSVVDKEGKRKLIATLHFKRSKGGVRKQPVVLVMFASDLQRWVQSQKGTEQSYLFPSPFLKDEPISHESVETALWNAGQRLGIKKRLHPHWLRHSGLSYFANQKNYNEQLLMWRAGWVNTDMARRYIHSGAELEKNAYLERSGLVVESKNKEMQISSKTCPHCQQPNPYTNDVCDLCAMPLDLTLYKAEIEKRRNIEQLYQNMQKISDRKLTEEQEMELSKRTDTVLALLELGREDLAREYMEKLLEHWTKAFLTSSF